jgi:hypothetical protein
MKRVQMILEDWQHDWLAESATRQQVSMSSLLRDLLTEAIELRQAASLGDDPLWGVIGLGEGPDDGVSSSNLDEFLYRTDWRPQQVRKAAESRVVEGEEVGDYVVDHR